MPKNLVDTTKLVRALNAKNGVGTFRSVTLTGDVRTIQRKEHSRWEDYADTDNLGELARLVAEHLPEVTGGKVRGVRTLIAFGKTEG